jgi:2'-5' RNA ligase
MVRCFVGILLPQEIKNKIASIQENIKSMPISCKFVEPENIHICLSFLGEVEESKSDFISTLLDKICESYENLEIKIEKIKLIPNEKYVRVIAFNVESKLLDSLRNEISRKIGGDSKPLHVTLCRVKNISDKRRFLELYKEIENSGVGTLTISSIQLIKSELSREGPKYIAVHESKLKTRS